MVRNLCRQEFTRRNLGFRCKEEEKNLFYRSQWRDGRIVFLVYRTLTFLYSLVWVIAWYIYYGIREPERLATAYKYFTIWAEAANAIYFCLSFVLSAVGVARRERSNRLESGTIKLLRSATWMFFGTAFMIQVVMIIMFWGFLVPTAGPGWTPTAFTYHKHLVTVIMIVIDIFVVAFPIRLLHFIYSVLGGAIYISMTLILHAADVDHRIYSFLDWADNPGVAAGVSLGLCFFGTALIQSLAFGFYLLRLLIYKGTCGSRAPSQSDSSPAGTNESKTLQVENGFYNATTRSRVVIRQESLPKPSDYF